MRTRAHAHSAAAKIHLRGALCGTAVSLDRRPRAGPAGRAGSRHHRVGTKSGRGKQRTGDGRHEASDSIARTRRRRFADRRPAGVRERRRGGGSVDPRPGPRRPALRQAGRRLVGISRAGRDQHREPDRRGGKPPSRRRAPLRRRAGGETASRGDSRDAGARARSAVRRPRRPASPAGKGRPRHQHRVSVGAARHLQRSHRQEPCEGEGPEPEGGPHHHPRGRPARQAPGRLGKSHRTHHGVPRDPVSRCRGPQLVRHRRRLPPGRRRRGGPGHPRRGAGGPDPATAHGARDIRLPPEGLSDRRQDPVGSPSR